MKLEKVGCFKSSLYLYTLAAGVLLNQEEFPTLASGGGDEKLQPQSKEDENKELPYGPGPSLRPQSEFMS